MIPPKICPITYKPIGDGKYSKEGLKKISPKLTFLADLPFSAEQQRIEARKRADKMSIQGVQPKLSAKLDLAHSKFEIVDTGGKFILKPQSDSYLELPENEDLTMHLAETAGIEVPLHGLLYSADGSKTYFIKRFDRFSRKGKLAVEDFAQLAGETRDTKYNYTMERLVPMIEKHCTFPVVEKQKLLMRTLFNFMIGNEDMHLKNFSLITSEDGKIELTPAYDFLNTTIVLENAREEMALPLAGKKHNMNRNNFIDYFARQKLDLNDRTIDDILNKIKVSIPDWERLLEVSFLSKDMRTKYLRLIHQRREVLHV